MKDVSMRKGSLVCAYASPRRAAKKFVYVIGGSHRELGSAWTKEEYTYDSVECYDIYAKQWRQVKNSVGSEPKLGLTRFWLELFVCLFVTDATY